MITQEELKSLFYYNQLTGIFTRTRNGKEAGCKNTLSYIVIRIGSRLNNKLYLAHRLAWLYVYGSMPEFEIDHINGDPSDNRLVNLRSARHSENLRNLKLRVDNKSGYKGVTFDKKLNKFRAAYFKLGKRCHLGLFDCAEDASNAYNEYCKVFNFGFVRKI